MLFGLGVLKQQLTAHPKGRAAEVLVVTFGREVKVLADFVGIGGFQPPKELVAEGPTLRRPGDRDGTRCPREPRRILHGERAPPEHPPGLPVRRRGAGGRTGGRIVPGTRASADRAAQRDRRLVFTACAVGDPGRGADLDFMRSLMADGRSPHPVSGDKASFAEVFTFVTLAVLRASRPGTAAAPTQRPFPD